MNDFGRMIGRELLEEMHLVELLTGVEVMDESVFDQANLKAVFLAGGPGSGKTAVSSEVFGVPKPFNFSVGGLRSVNNDVAFEILMKKAGYGLKLNKLSDDEFNRLTGDQPESLRSHAKELIKKQYAKYRENRVGVLVDGTGSNYHKIVREVKMLEALGYDCMMVFVNTSLDTALARNHKRERTVPDSLVITTWKEVQANLGRFQDLFGNNMIIIDNNDTSGIRISDAARSAIERFMRAPIENHIGREWIERELRMRDRLHQEPEKKGLKYGLKGPRAK